MSYEYNLKNAYVFPSRITDRILYIDLTVNNETTRYSEDAEYNRMSAAINSVLDLLKEEIHYESGYNAGYDQFVNKKKRRTEIVHDAIEKAKIEEQKRLEAEKIDSEERKRFFTINNRLSVGEFLTCLKSELLKGGIDKDVKEFDSLRLVDGIDFDAKFGLGSFTFKKYEDEIILSIYHNYSMYGINGKLYNYTDKRDLIQLDCMFEDLLDLKAIKQKQIELISSIEGTLRSVEGMFNIKQQKMAENMER